MLIIRVINFELVQPTVYAHGTSTLQRDGQTDRRTDDLRKKQYGVLHYLHRAVKMILNT